MTVGRRGAAAWVLGNLIVMAFVFWAMWQLEPPPGVDPAQYEGGPGDGLWVMFFVAAPMLVTAAVNALALVLVAIWASLGRNRMFSLAFAMSMGLWIVGGALMSRLGLH